LGYVWSLLGEQEAFEKCWAHSPLRAVARPFTRCRCCRTRASMSTTTTRDRGPLWPHGMGPVRSNDPCLVAISAVSTVTVVACFNDDAACAMQRSLIGSLFFFAVCRSLVYNGNQMLFYTGDAKSGSPTRTTHAISITNTFNVTIVVHNVGLAPTSRDMFTVSFAVLVVVVSMY